MSNQDLSGSVWPVLFSARAVRGPAYKSVMRLQHFLLIATVLAAPLHARAAEPNGWVNLYNGKNLDGWVQHGGKAQYRAEGSDLVGAAVPNTPTPFCTTRSFKNCLNWNSDR